MQAQRMTTPFFSSPKIRSSLLQYSNALKALTGASAFEKDRNELIIRIFDVFMEKPDEWDERASYNIEQMGGVFERELDDKTLAEEEINIVFTTCFRFCLEPISFSSYVFPSYDIIKAIKDFGIYNHDKFDDRSRTQIDYALREMPINIVKSFFDSEDVKTFKSFNEQVREAKKTSIEWKKYIKEEEKKINDIKSTLKTYESAFNFVGLYDGFNTLWKQKKGELVLSKLLLLILAAIIPTPLIFELSLLRINANHLSTLSQAITLIPLISLTFIFIYYFRVALQHHSSLRTQILQLELRRSLCQFIQSYADYSKGVREGNPGALSKFEDIIFSNIMPTEEKIPSTFDGLEQIASLINSIKPK